MSIGAAEFKAHGLQLMDQVAAGGEPITITKRCKPVARLVAIEPPSRQGRLASSIISVWEVAKLHSKGRIWLSMPPAPWLEQALAPPGLTQLPLMHPTVKVDACTLPGEFHADPADRILVATARAENATLVSRDEKILTYAQAGHVRALAV